jgi:hypothetical protein
MPCACLFQFAGQHLSASLRSFPAPSAKVLRKGNRLFSDYLFQGERHPWIYECKNRASTNKGICYKNYR